MSSHQYGYSQVSDVEQFSEKISTSTAGVVSQEVLGNSFLRSIIETMNSIGGVPETCAEAAQDSWLENTVESLFGWLGIGNDPEHCDTESESEASPAQEPVHPPSSMYPPRPEPQVPPINLTPYKWLIGVYVRSEALSVMGAEALLTQASLPQLAATLQPGPAAEQPDQAPVVPAADLAAHPSSQARPLDWDAPLASWHVSPEASATDVEGPSLREAFQAHLTDTMLEELGAGVSLSQVRGAIGLAEAVGRLDVAAHLQARLTRANQYALVSTLNVERSDRYAPSGSDTFCNIYAYDFITAMGAYIPRTWWYESAIQRIQGGAQPVRVSDYEARLRAGESVTELITPIYADTVRELDANSLNIWMQTWGASFGWRPAPNMTEAQDAANAGNVVVVLATGVRVPGHISVVLAEKGDLYAARDPSGTVYAPLQSQAGAMNVNHDNLSRGEDRDQWWEDANHVEGAAWINSGSASSPILSPESLGR